MFGKKKKKKYREMSFNPDEVFIDSLNLSQLDTQQMEGEIEKPLSLSSLFIFRIIILVTLFIFSTKVFLLQVVKGQWYRELSEENVLREIPLFATRGVILDRYGIPLAWNDEGKEEEGFGTDAKTHFPRRRYIEKGFSHILGYVQYPKKDKNGFYWMKEIEGEAGLEKLYNDYLSGENGALLIEVNAKGEKVSGNLVREAIDGKNLKLTIDSKLQLLAFEELENYVNEHHFRGAAFALMDIYDGSLFALVSYPEFSSEEMTNHRSSVSRYLLDERKPFFNRLVSGLYPPGSTVKPFIAFAALNEGIIRPDTKILSTGKIELKNPYNPQKPYVYRDWKKGGHGWTDVRKAIAESVNTFFYEIGGGYEGQKGLGIEKIHDYLSSFGLGEKTGFTLSPEKEGVIPSPEWKKKQFHGDPWRLGDTYISSIGQFGFLVSPLQLLRSIASLANGGFLVKPKIVLDEASTKTAIPYRQLRASQEIRVVREGMRQVVTKGTAQNINLPFVHIAAKSGTAQVGLHNEYYDSWVVGFFPYENPKYAFVVFLEKGQKKYGGSASALMRNILLRIQKETELAKFYFHMSS